MKNVLKACNEPRRRDRYVFNCPLFFETFEERKVLAITVDMLVDEADGSIIDGDVSLRDALAVAQTGDTIRFDSSLDGGTIVLSLGELQITKGLTVDAKELPTALNIDASGNDPTPEIDNGDYCDD